MKDYTYDYVRPFSEGLATVRNNGWWFHIHPDGSPAYEERFNSVGDFCEGIALAEKDGRSFLIRPDGTRAD